MWRKQTPGEPMNAKDLCYFVMGWFYARNVRTALTGSWCLHHWGLERETEDLDLLVEWREDLYDLFMEFLRDTKTVAFWVYQGDKDLTAIHLHPSLGQALDLFLVPVPEDLEPVSFHGRAAHCITKEHLYVIKQQWSTFVGGKKHRKDLAGFESLVLDPAKVRQWAERLGVKCD